MVLWLCLSPVIEEIYPEVFVDRISHVRFVCYALTPMISYLCYTTLLVCLYH